MEERQFQVKFDETMFCLFQDMEKTITEYNLKRINSIVLLKALLEEKDSVFYECICATFVAKENPYKQIIADCNEKLKEIAEKESEIGEEEQPFKLQFSDNSQEIQFFLSENFRNIMSKTYTMLIEYGVGAEKENVQSEITINSVDLFLNFINDTPKDALTILKNNGVFLEGVKEYYELLAEIYNTDTVEVLESDEEDEDKLPMSISDFATVLTAKYKGVEDCEILGRDKECSKIMRALQKRGKKNAILIGEPGVGKTAIAEKIAYDIANGNCPESLKNHIVIQVDVNNSIAGTMYRGMAEERFKLLVEYLNTHDNVILFIDEIHMVIGAGATSGHDSGNMSNALKPFLASKKAKVIGATTEKEYEMYFSRDEAFRRRFEKIYVKEPKSKEVYPMLKKSIEAHEKFHGVKINEDMINYAILISSCFDNTTNNPDRTNDLIDSAMVIAKEKGKEYVDRECILENFNINFEKFEKLEEREKLSTAYHEAGHYIVGRKSGRLKDWKGIAISIMPAEWYLGITVYDDLSDEVTTYPDKEYYIDLIARTLAGRVAEKLYTNTISSGASNDLEKVNKRAYDIISKYGMSDKFGNRIYLEDENYHMMSEKIRNDIDEEVKDLINKATKRAEEIISQNEELLKKIVDALMEKKILDENDLEEICKEE